MKSTRFPAMATCRLALILIFIFIFVFIVIALPAFAQHDADEPTSVISFLIVKDDNGKPVRNAAVIMHPVGSSGKQGRGGVELKTDGEGKTSFDGIPYGKLRVQVLASGFQTFGEDYEVTQSKMSVTVQLKRPQGQYSIYESHPAENKKPEAPPSQSPNSRPQ